MALYGRQRSNAIVGDGVGPSLPLLLMGRKIKSESPLAAPRGRKAMPSPLAVPDEGKSEITYIASSASTASASSSPMELENSVQAPYIAPMELSNKFLAFLQNTLAAEGYNLALFEKVLPEKMANFCELRRAFITLWAAAGIDPAFYTGPTEMRWLFMLSWAKHGVAPERVPEWGAEYALIWSCLGVKPEALKIPYASR